MRAILQLGVAVCVCGCAFAEVDYAGKACPCPDGWGCRADDQLCVRLEGEGDCAIQAHNFHVGWATPNTIRWEWDPVGDGADFAGYRVRVGVGSDPASSTDVREFTSDDNPELGYFQLPHTAGVELVRSTITGPHTEATLHWGQLVAIDNQGCTWSSEVLTRTTGPVPAFKLDIFDDVQPPDSWLLPDVAVIESTGPSQTGSSHIRFSYPATASKGDNVQLGGLEIPLDDTGANLQSLAFVELYVWLTGDQHSFWSRVILAAAPPADQEVPHFRREGLTIKGDDEYHLVQIPISALLPDAGTPMAPSDVLRKFMFGCTPFKPDTTLLIDSVSVRW